MPQQCYFTFRYILKRNAHICSKKEIYKDLYGTFTHYNPKWKKYIYTTILKWIAKLWDNHTAEILQINKNDWTITQNNMDELHNVEWKKPTHTQNTDLFHV